MPVPLVAGVVAVGTIILGGMVSSSCRPLFNMMSQQLFKLFPNELIPPINLISMRYRGLITEDHYYKECQLGGISRDRAELLYHESEQRLNAYDVIGLWRRGGIDENTRNERIMQAGWTEDRIPHLVNLTRQIPSASDVIAFAVREVYSPEIAEEFGQYEGGDRVFETAEADILATGMDQETFVKYWASHWQLPSMGQGYEMLHRGVIDEARLDKLMEAADIMPGWREQLKAISYNVLTRVDVRRMHKIGVLSDDELVKAYMDVGYDSEKAEQLAQFTIQYNYDPESSQVTEEDKEAQRLKEITQSSIIKSYKKGLISIDQAKLYLQDLGYATGAIDLYIANADFDLQEEIEDEQIATIHDAFVRSIIDYNQTVSRLGTLNLPAKYMEALLDRWDIERQLRTSKPTKKELTSMLKANVIDLPIFRSELAALGYSEKYVTWYIRLYQSSGAQAVQ